MREAERDAEGVDDEEDALDVAALVDVVGGCGDVERDEEEEASRTTVDANEGDNVDVLVVVLLSAAVDCAVADKVWANEVDEDDGEGEKDDDELLTDGGDATEKALSEALRPN